MKETTLGTEIITQDISQAPGLYPLQEWLLPYIPVINFMWSGIFLIVLLSVIFYYVIAPYIWPNESTK